VRKVVVMEDEKVGYGGGEKSHVRKKRGRGEIEFFMIFL
jgi:hypothetical protein